MRKLNSTQFATKWSCFPFPYTCITQLILRVNQILLKVEFKLNWFLAFWFTHFCLPSSKSVVNTCTRNFWRILLLRKTQTFTQWSFNLRSTCTTCILFFFRSVDLVSCFTGHPDFRRHGLCYGHASGETLPRCQDNRNLRRN